VNLHYRPLALNLRHPFTIARGSRTQQENVLVEISDGHQTGYGEAAPSLRYGENQESVIKFLSNVDLSQFTEPFYLEDILAYINDLDAGNNAAKAAIDIALHDLIGKKLNIPIWKFFGLNPQKNPLTSFTIGIDVPGVIEEKIKEADEFPILKVKVGVPNDEEIITTIRKFTNKSLRVDANEGWKTKDVALEKILWLESQGVEFVEQPMPAEKSDEIAWLKGHIHIPIIADEGLRTLHDMPKLQGVYDGINIKLMKCGGIHNAMKIIHTAKAMNMKIMLGCMIESSAAISAAAQLSPLVDYADLDGNLLISNDPFSGLNQSMGKIYLPHEYGLGVKLS
jgi:L-alanine-DL-glutamate epimerase-like enolase superfamily enzyme